MTSLSIDFNKHDKLKSQAINRQTEALMQVIPYEAYKRDNVMTDILRLHCAVPNYSINAIVCGECSARDVGVNIIYPCNTLKIIADVLAKAYGIEKEISG